MGIWNGHSTHLLRLNYECKIECLHPIFGCVEFEKEWDKLHTGGAVL